MAALGRSHPPVNRRGKPLKWGSYRRQRRWGERRMISMKWREIGNRVTGFSVSFFGISWNPPVAEVRLWSSPMHLLYTDEVNMDPGTAEFFVYAGVALPGDRARQISEEIEAARRQNGYKRGDLLKFNTVQRPPPITPDQHKSVKQAVMEIAAQHASILQSAAWRRGSGAAARAPERWSRVSSSMVLMSMADTMAPTSASRAGRSSVDGPYQK